MQFTDAEILAKVEQVIREQLELPPETPIHADADFSAQLGGDSLDLAEVVMRIEEEFDLNAPDSAVAPPVTPAKLAALVRQAIEAKSTAPTGAHRGP